MEAAAIVAAYSEDSAGEAFLEKMLKDAKELSIKIKSHGGDIVSNDYSASIGSDHSGITMPKENTDPMADQVLLRAEQMIQEMKRAAKIIGPITPKKNDDTSNNQGEGEPEKVESSPQKSVKRDTYTDLDEVLRQSEALLKQMRSPKFSQADAASVTPNETMPAVRTPSSVYVLQSSNGADDVSSVGSGSLLAPGTSKQHNGTSAVTAASLEMSKLMEELAAIPEPPPSSASSNLRRLKKSDLFTGGEEKVDRDNVHQDDSSSSYQASYSGFMSASKLMTDAVQDRINEEKVPDHTNGNDSVSVVTPQPPADDYVPVMDFSPKTSKRSIPPMSPGGPYPVKQAPIPDFTKVDSNAKWEKVESATQGDDDYVPLVDYSKSPGIAKSKSTASSSVSQSGRESKLEAYRRQQRIRRKRNQRLFAAVIAAIAVFYFIFQASTAKSNSSKVNVSPSVQESTPVQTEKIEEATIPDIIDIETSEEEIGTENIIEPEELLQDTQTVEEDGPSLLKTEITPEPHTDDHHVDEMANAEATISDEIDPSEELPNIKEEHDLLISEDSRNVGAVGNPFGRLTRFVRAVAAFFLAFVGVGR
jgi:hypothetical protein